MADAQPPRAPKYYLVKRRLSEMVRSLPAGSPVPAERTLAADFGTSRTTVRQALAELVVEGRLERVQGRGTFVSLPKVDQLLRLTSYTEDMRAQGVRPASRLLRAVTVRADEALARHLALSRGDRVLRLERLRLADGEPMAVERSFLPARRFPGLRAHLVRNGGSASLYEVLSDRYGVRPAEGEEIVETALATPEEAGLLGVDTGLPMLLLTRSARDRDGVPVEWTRAVYRGDRYRFLVELRRPLVAANPPVTNPRGSHPPRAADNVGARAATTPAATGVLATGVVVVSGTGTGVATPIVTAAVAAVARAQGRTVGVVKAAQTGLRPGEPGDLDGVQRLTGLGPDDVREIARFAPALAPAAAARLEGHAGPALAAVADAVRELADHRDLVLVEGAGGLLVRFAADGWTVADLAVALAAPVIVVADPGLGTLNRTALTLEALAARGLTCAGVVLGSWPGDADLACRANLADLEDLARTPLAGVLPAGAGGLDPDRFAALASQSLGPSFGGRFDAADFRRRHDPPEGRAGTEERR